MRGLAFTSATRLVAFGAAVTALGLAACGERGPEEVAERVDRATYECGEQGAGLIYDLTIPSAHEVSRQQAISNERRSGCTPESRPETETLLVCEQADRAVVQHRAADGTSRSDVYVKADDGWLLDPDTDTTDVCGPGAPT